MASVQACRVGHLDLAVSGFLSAMRTPRCKAEDAFRTRSRREVFDGQLIAQSPPNAGLSIKPLGGIYNEKSKALSALLLMILSPILLTGCSEDTSGEARVYCETNPDKCGAEVKITW